ncbi:ABC transporter permease [Pseudacidobacterium ailaaui]|jgi:putative ABC transport system permease protein|uniref:ABC transporter permease n=1 Tax=Pseudacidobacterium ailaaui TaxID=1382359 RepID=UPI00047DF9B1|nr:ABC transporter permease [Pseudacidobacterium ailaaui]MBX6360399.1 ABC transporter permease [Pseudacidobacterium ailaaui]MCL6463189.1 ABC transporter permease [Pseudacidobacterium ailaaui]MDI3255383.1 ABC transporter permease [Bacillota bacterium]
MNPVTTRISTRASFEKTLASAKRTMVLSEIVHLALDSFRASKVRFALTALGMVIGSASLILVVTIGLTGKQYILNLLQSIGTNMVELEYSGGGTGSINNFQNDYLTRDDERAVREQVPSVMYSSPMLEMHDRISFGQGRVKDVLVLGVSPEYRMVRNLKVLSGRFFDDQDEETHTKVAVVTQDFAVAMFGSAESAVNQSFQISGIPFTIIGTFRESVDTFGQSEIADQTILIPYSVARYFTGTDNVKQIFFSIRDQSDVETAAQEIVRVVSARHQKNSVYKANTLTALLTTAAKIANGLTIVLLLITTVTLAVGGVGIMNIMLATVRSRIREIGIRKALGATAREIKLQFLIEAVFISLAGGIVGIVVGLALPFSVRFLTDYRIPISGWSVIIALLTSTLVGVVFGTLPATRAAQLDPVESLKYE